MARTAWQIAGCVALALAVAGCSDDPSGLPVNASCKTNKDCADGVCHSFCASPNPVEEGKPCEGHGNCKSFNCQGGFCRKGIVTAGGACLTDKECRYGFCGPYGLCGGSGKDGGVPDAGMPDTGVPDTGVPDTGVPDTGKPDTGKPDTTQPDTTQPDKAVPDMTPPDQAVPDTASLCGNGKLDITESCDGKLLGGKTCTTQGFTAGVLDCKKDCTLEQRGCYKLQPTKAVSLGYNTYPAVAAGSTEFLTTWFQSGGVHGATVKQDGTPKKSFYIQAGSLPAVASGGKDYLAVWQSGSHLRGATVTPAGKIQYPSFLLGSLGSNRPAVSFDGTNYLVVGSGSGMFQGRFVSTKGAILGSAAFAISPKGHGSYAPAVAFDGTNYLVVWSRYKKPEIWGQLVDKTGALKGGLIKIEVGTTGNLHYPKVAYGAGQYLVVWEDTRNSKISDIIGARVNTKGQVTHNTIKVAVTSNGKAEPSVVFAGGRFLVMWRWSQNSWTNYLDGTQVTPSGVPVHTGAPIRINSPSKVEIKLPAVAYGGGKVLVVWRSGAAAYNCAINSAVLTFGQ